MEGSISLMELEDDRQVDPFGAGQRGRYFRVSSGIIMKVNLMERSEERSDCQNKQSSDLTLIDIHQEIGDNDLSGIRLNCGDRGDHNSMVAIGSRNDTHVTYAGSTNSTSGFSRTIHGASTTSVTSMVLWLQREDIIK